MTFYPVVAPFAFLGLIILWTTRSSSKRARAEYRSRVAEQLQMRARTYRKNAEDQPIYSKGWLSMAEECEALAVSVEKEDG